VGTQPDGSGTCTCSITQEMYDNLVSNDTSIDERVSNLEFRFRECEIGQAKYGCYTGPADSYFGMNTYLGVNSTCSRGYQECQEDYTWVHA